MIIKQNAQTIQSVIIDDCHNSIEEFVAVVRYKAKVQFSDAYCQRVTAGRNALETAIASGTGIYGVNTGFGDNVRYRISQEEMVTLQENILRSHGCAVGRPLSEEEARGLMMMQLLNIGKGYSAVSLEMLEQIRTFLNEGLYPYVPCEGSVGGLIFQPYVAITYMGEGRLIENGQILPAAEVLKAHGIRPVPVKAREGLALLSNASHSIGVGLLAVYDLVMTMRHADIGAALVCEALGSTDKAFDPRLIALKNRREAEETAAFLREILKDSCIMEESRSLRVQDSQNTRIIPHVHGTAKRMLAQTYEVLMEELYAVFDNPVFLPDGTALMGGNWDATAIELYCDSLAIAVMDVAKLTEVHMERLVDPHLSGLPAFLVKNPGLNNGFMIPQYTTAGLLGDIALLASPAACFNAAVSAGQESPIYRDDTAARQLYQAVQKLRHMVSMTMMTALQAIDLRENRGMSPVTQKIHDEVRKTVSFMENDDMMYERIEAMEQLVSSCRLLEGLPVPFTH